MIIDLPYKFTPRDYQSELLKAIFVDKIRHVYWVLHRRAGKDKTCINIITALACQRVGTHIYLLPQHNQARKVVWKGMDGAGMRFIDHIPPQLIAKKNNQDMTIELINGSIITLCGSNNYDSLMGTNPVSIIYSEFSLHHPLAREYLNPILTENKGFELLQGTPRGRNHAKSAYDAVKGEPDWYCRTLSINDTKDTNGNPIITEADIERLRRQGMPEELIKQEFYCSWDVGQAGSYYTDELDKAELEGRITTVPPVPRVPVHTFWDIGLDGTAIWFMQPVGDHLHLIHYHERSNLTIDYFARYLEETRQRLNLRWGYHWGPHDIEHGSVIALSKKKIASEMGIEFMTVPRCQKKDDSIQAAKWIMFKCRFDKNECRLGLEMLREYRREYDDVNRIFKEKPLHNFASHGADAFQGMAMIWQSGFANTSHNAPRLLENELRSPSLLSRR